jgi:hypothetical protein
MAKECFCGCGRLIGRFPLGTRAINGRGKQVAERLAWARALELDEQDPTLKDWFEEGDEIEAELRSAMHDEIDPRSLAPDKVGHWQRYGRNIERVVVGTGLPSINTWIAAGSPPTVFKQNADEATS